MTDARASIRRARAGDVTAIAELVDAFAAPGFLLPRSPEEIGATIDDWFVAYRGQALMACGSLLPYSPALAEVRSLAVAPEAQGNGLGGAVLAALIVEAERRQHKTLFALTRAVAFFEAHGFGVGRRIEFPEKVWRDCLACPFIDDCDETAVVLDLPAGPRGGGEAHPPQERGVPYVQERR